MPRTTILEPRTNLSRTAIANAVSHIDGYYIPSPTFPGGAEAAFKRAQEECKANALKSIAAVAAITLAQFMATTKRSMVG